MTDLLAAIIVWFNQTSINLSQITIETTYAASPSPTLLPSTRPTITPSPAPKIKPTPKPSPPQSILTSLNQYRQQHGKPPLKNDASLQQLAQDRSNFFQQQGALDNHAGFNTLMQQGTFAKLGFVAYGENSSWGHNPAGSDLIKAYAASPSHNQNQLNPQWTHVGIGVSGTFTNLLFGRKR